MRKLFNTLGEYYIGFYKINLSIKLFDSINWSDFNREEMATLIHEYIHYLQDISTTKGINYFIYLSKILQLHFSEAYKRQCIYLPLDIEQCSVENAYKESELQKFYQGYDEHIKVKFINDITCHNDKNEIINLILGNEYPLCVIKVYYDNKVDPYEFGSVAVAESMAYLIEKEAFGALERINEFPYNLCEMICQKECPSLLDNKPILVAACELSLMHYHSGQMFFEIIQEIKKQNLKFKNIDEFEKYFYPKASFLYDNLKNAFKEIPSVINFLYPKDQPEFLKVNDKVICFLEKGKNYRLNNKLFISRLLESTNTVSLINQWMHYFGMPLLSDINDNIYTADKDLIFLLGPLAMYNFFMQINSNMCTLSQYCCKQNIENYDCQICKNQPWLQANKDRKCIFGLYWYLYSLTDVTVYRRQ